MTKNDDFITTRTSLVESVFRMLLANGNNPLTPTEMGERLRWPPMTILRTIAGVRVYKGIRPCPDCTQ